MVERKKNTDPPTWVVAIFVVVVLVEPQVGYWQHVYKRYWILKDGVQGMGHVTGVGGHNSVAYTYTVNGQQFTGYGYRPLEREFESVGVGQDTILRYSASHPWISSPRQIDALFLDGLAWVFIVTLIQGISLAYLVKMSLKWIKTRSSTSPANPTTPQQ